MKRTLKYLFVILLLSSFSVVSAQSATEFLNKGIKLMSKQQFENALENFEKAYKLKSNDPNILAFRGQAKHSLNQYKEAIADYDKALQLQSNYAEVYHLRGLAKYELKDYEGACSDWEKANQLNYSGVIDLIIEFCMEKGKN
ncbi:MAG: tetratricopeptide repeat protein [Bacteroidales bacterium]|jgi:tetratricopeptide (TPR) repeat protein|nr:tetratricopeptide repeat protein [Bacteroidales bacterium]